MVWTTDCYERVPWQKTKNVWIGQPYSEAAYKVDVQAHAWSGLSRTVRISLTSDAIGGSD